MSQDMALTKSSSFKEMKSLINNILDPQELEIFAVSGDGCEVVFSKAGTQNNLNNLKSDIALYSNCRKSYANSFPGICDHCHHGKKACATESGSFEINDNEDRTYLANSVEVEWFDGKSASVFAIRDVTKEKELIDHLYALAYVDGLTGVPNRQKLKEDFSALGDKIVNGELHGAIALFDIDYFKAVNDTYGHNIGDQVLSRIAEQLESDEVFSGHLFRLGGDEFVFLFFDPVGTFGNAEEMEKHYKDLLQSALREYSLPNDIIKCTLTIGVSFFPKHGTILSELLKKADIALYRGKGAGRNQLIVYAPEHDS